MGELSRSRTTLLIACLVLIWGMSWPIYKLALEYTPPILFSGMRCVLGGVLLIIFAIHRYKDVRWKQNWHIYLISAALNAVLFYIFQTVGLRYLPSGLFSVVVYLQPVVVGVFAWLWLGESMSGLKIFGLILGFLGVASISLESFSGHISMVGFLLALASALSWGLGTVYTKKVASAVDPIWLVAIQFLIGGLVMTGIGSAVENWSAIQWHELWYLGGLIYGGVFGVSISWVIYFVLVRSGDASKVASFTFLTPLIAVLTGTLFLHEAFTVYLFVGIVLIVASIYLVNRRMRQKLSITDRAYADSATQDVG